MTIKTFADLCEQNVDIAAYFINNISEKKRVELKRKLKQAILLDALATLLLIILFLIVLCITWW